MEWEKLEQYIFRKYGHMECMHPKRHPLENILLLISHLHSENSSIRSRADGLADIAHKSGVINNVKKQQGLGEVDSPESREGGGQRSAWAHPGPQAGPFRSWIISAKYRGGIISLAWDMLTAGFKKKG